MTAVSKDFPKLFLCRTLAYRSGSLHRLASLDAIALEIIGFSG